MVKHRHIFCICSHFIHTQNTKWKSGVCKLVSIQLKKLKKIIANAEKKIGVQLSSMKPDIKDICQNVKPF